MPNRVAQFEDQIIEHILKMEGGYQNKKSDVKGNTNSKGVMVGTNFGISAPVYEKIIGRPPTAQDMKSITKEEAAKIYRQQYIEPVSKRYGIPRDHPAYQQVVDMNVNHSPEGVKSMLQRAVGTKVDGIVGPKTRAAISATPDLNNRLVEERKKYYQMLMKNDPALEPNRKGWMNRAEQFRQ